MAAPGKRNANEPEPRPIIVKKIIVEGHAGHHGGAWKVAYADFVTAMMAFFLLMWLLGATTEKQRKGLADYFTPTLVEIKTGSAGANGLFGGDSLTGKDNYPTTGGQGNLAITIPRDATGTADKGGRDMKDRDQTTFNRVKQQVEANLRANKALAKLMANIRMTETREGLRIDLIDQADFAMFAIGTDRLVPQARTLIGEVARVVSAVPNGIIVRGHTDGLQFTSSAMNNWMLSSARAETTRRTLGEFGVSASRFAKIEGVADREPFVADNVNDPRNRRMSIILAWTGPAENPDALAAEQTSVQRVVQLRDDPQGRARKEILTGDMGQTTLPKGAIPINMLPPRDTSKGPAPKKPAGSAPSGH